MKSNISALVPAAILLFAVLQSPAYSALPTCSNANSDADGDGYGWENDTSCRVASSGDRPICKSADSDPDKDGYGWENGKTCRVSTLPDPKKIYCTDPASDPDGDGYGWENSQSCIVNENDDPRVSHPQCTSALSDPDGDGFGWENDKTCLVQVSSNVVALSPSGNIDTATPTFSWSGIDNADEYKIVVRDSEGNGYSRRVDPVTASCQTGTGLCSFMPDLGYYDNDLTWHIEPTVNGQSAAHSNRLSITTPLSANMQPIKSNQTSCEAWASVAYDNFVVLNNSWNSRTMSQSTWSQTINVDQDLQGVTRPSWNYNRLGRYDGDEIEVKAYPEVLYGSKLGTHVSGSKAETGLPELVRNLPEFVIDYAYTETGNAERNVALESFFHDSCNIAGPCDEVDNRAYEMMIWVNNPTIRTPGKLALTGVLIDNQYWNVYIKPDSNKHYIAFTAQTPQTSGTLNWNRFVDWTRDWTTSNSDALQIDALSADFCMGAIELGTEMWWGSGSFTLNKFDISF